MLSIIELMRMFPDDKAAEDWFIAKRWPDGIRCPFCNGGNINDDPKHPTLLKPQKPRMFNLRRCPQSRCSPTSTPPDPGPADAGRG